jgi:hypothetical protein
MLLYVHRLFLDVFFKRIDLSRGKQFSIIGSSHVSVHFGGVVTFAAMRRSGGDALLRAVRRISSARRVGCYTELSDGERPRTWPPKIRHCFYRRVRLLFPCCTAKWTPDIKHSSPCSRLADDYALPWSITRRFRSLLPDVFDTRAKTAPLRYKRAKSTAAGKTRAIQW